jgi:tetratricopeptide (TPR) repeat protein
VVDFMALIALRCPQCGGEIQLENVREIGFCMYCGSKVVLQEALKHEVTVDESHKVDAWITLGFESLKSKKFDDAEQYANKIIEADLNNPTGWYIKGCCAIKEESAVEYWKKALAYSNNNEASKKYCIETLNNPQNYFRIKMRTIIVTREKERMGSKVPFYIDIGDAVKFYLNDRETKSFRIQEGFYVLSARLSTGNSETTQLNIYKDTTVYLRLVRTGGIFHMNFSVV